MGMAILLAFVCFYIVKSGKEGVRKALIEDIIPAEGLKLSDIHYAQTDPEKALTWALDAREMTTSEDENSISFNKFRIKVKPKDRPEIELTGARGSYSRISGEINLWGDLKGISSDGYQIATDHIMIKEKSRQLTTTSPVVITGPFFSVKGRGLLVDLEKKTLKILANVTAVIDEESIS